MPWCDCIHSPRQVGLAGSSAIVYSCIKALMSFFGLGYRDIPKHVLPSVVLSVENELGINAGLQVPQSDCLISIIIDDIWRFVELH